jgi:hypothetical protein
MQKTMEEICACFAVEAVTACTDEAFREFQTETLQEFRAQYKAEEDGDYEEAWEVYLQNETDNNWDGYFAEWLENYHEQNWDSYLESQLTSNAA